MAPLHVATLTVQRKYICSIHEFNMAWLPDPYALYCGALDALHNLDLVYLATDS